MPKLEPMRWAEKSIESAVGKGLAVQPGQSERCECAELPEVRHFELWYGGEISSIYSIYIAYQRHYSVSIVFNVISLS